VEVDEGTLSYDPTESEDRLERLAGLEPKGICNAE
jgi:hypothetical protein